ncbi:MAG TPA: DUF2071 domain-containing protein [Mycobacteriales bacterium]|jgi:hypothetical protein|nr:DUF2071 domain-containing protein [Mycobacteriales bacterium]
MRHRWDNLTFLHWPYEPATVQALLPAHLTVEPYDGAAWVGLVPFDMTVVGAGRFPETNVRTYVTGPDGTTGVWFFSLDAARLDAVLAARTALRLPYQWSRMRTGRRGTTVRYRCERRWPDAPAHNVTDVEVGEPVDEPTELENYLTARFALWTPDGSRMQAHHPPWALRHATVTRLDDSLVTAAGLPQPDREPLAHYSDGVAVRIGLPGR